MRTTSTALFGFIIATAACEPKEDESTSSYTSSSTTELPPTDTGSEHNTWALGLHYRPAKGPSEILATIEVRSDQTALLRSESCNSDIIETYEIRWKPLDDDSITFEPMNIDEPLRWFGAPIVGETITLSQTDLIDTVSVTDGKTLDNAYMGDFRRTDTPLCLMTVDTTVSCADGKTHVLECPAP